MTEQDRPNYSFAHYKTIEEIQKELSKLPPHVVRGIRDILHEFGATQEALDKINTLLKERDF